MEFKRMNMREIILIISAAFLIVMTMIFNFKSKSREFPDNQISVPILPPSMSNELVRPAENLKIEEDDGAVQKEMKDQMDRDRNQQRQIKMLKMQLEQMNLQLDNEKALTEINKLKKENTGYVKDSNPQIGIGFPNIRIIYIGGTDNGKEAILSIDGTSYSVREKDKPVSNVEILAVTDKSVRVHFSSPQELTTVVNYVQE